MCYICKNENFRVLWYCTILPTLLTSCIHSLYFIEHSVTHIVSSEADKGSNSELLFEMSVVRAALRGQLL